MATKLPIHFGQTMRQYKQQKRKQFKAARESVSDLRFGSAYLPSEAYHKFIKANNLIEEAYEICKLWWKKA